jgi:superfamily II DNA helicase RecQ
VSQIVACTATADQSTLQEIRHCLGMQDSTKVIAMPIYRHNLSLHVVHKHPREGEVDLVRAVRLSRAERVLVFCRKRDEAARVSELLTQNAIRCTSYHSAVEDRQGVLKAFSEGAR